MERYFEAKPGDVVDILCDEPFKLFLSKGGKPIRFVGPPEVGQRRTAFRVPEGYDGLVVEAVAKAVVVCDITPVASRKERVDPTRLVQEITPDGPQSVNDLVANLVRRELLKRQDLDEEAETIEEANDFDMPDDDLHPWEVEYRDLEPEPGVDPRSDTAPETAAEAPPGAETAPAEPEPAPEAKAS